MLNLTAKSTTKIGLLVTSIVLLGACSAKQVKQEAQAFEATPEPIVEESYNQTQSEYQASATPEIEPAPSYTAPVKHKLSKKKKKVKHASVKAKKSKRGSKVAKHSKRQEKQAAAVAQVDNNINNTPTGGGYVPPVMEQSQAPVIPPPPFMDTAAPVETDGSARIGLWATVMAAALVLCGLAYRVRRGKASQRRLVFNR